MTIKWNKLAVNNLMAAISFIEESGYEPYAQKLAQRILGLFKNRTNTCNTLWIGLG